VELLGDLIIVAALVNLGETLSYGGPQLLYPVLVIFFAVLNATTMMSQYINRFESHGLVHLLVFSFVLLGVFLMVLSINDTTHHGLTEWSLPRAYMISFVIGFAISRLGLVLLMLAAAACVPAARRAQGLQAVCLAVSLTIAILGTALTESPAALSIVYSACIALELVSTELLMFSPSKWVRGRGFAWPNLGHATTRTGIAVMISLGESVLQILVADFPTDSFTTHVRFALMAFIICYCLAMQYFDSQPNPEQYRRMRARHKRRDVGARLIQPFLLHSIFLVGVAFKLLLHFVLVRAHSSAKTHPEVAEAEAGSHHRRLADSTREAWSPWWECMNDVCILLGLSMCLCQLMLLIVRLLRDGRRSLSSCSIRAQYVARVVLALAHGAVGCISSVSAFFENIDSGVGSLECHLALIAPELLMHFAARLAGGTHVHGKQDNEATLAKHMAVNGIRKTNSV
jgi:low temperature requirement protein LtrA